MNNLKLTLALLLAIPTFSTTFSQIDKGSNYLKIGGMSFNQDVQLLDTYLPYLDTTGSDSTVYAGNNSYNLTLGYRIAVANNFSIGIESRFLASEESSFAIHAGGGSLRYHFPLFKIGADYKVTNKGEDNENKERQEHLVFSKTSQIARNFFFVDFTGLFGKMRYDNQTIDYKNLMLQLGASFRLPTNKKFLCRLGIEISGGASYRTEPGSSSGIYPVANAGVIFHFDKHLTRLNK